MTTRSERRSILKKIFDWADAVRDIRLRRLQEVLAVNIYGREERQATESNGSELPIGGSSCISIGERFFSSLCY